MIEHEILRWAVVVGALAFAVLLLAIGSLRYTKPIGYDDDQPRAYPSLGSYGPSNEGLPDISTGWHIFADGNMWCAVGPCFIDLQTSPSGWGYTPVEAYRYLMRVVLNANAFDILNRPQLADFVIHPPTIKPDAR